MVIAKQSRRNPLLAASRCNNELLKQRPALRPSAFTQESHDLSVQERNVTMPLIAYLLADQRVLAGQRQVLFVRLTQLIKHHKDLSTVSLSDSSDLDTFAGALS